MYFLFSIWLPQFTKASSVSLTALIIDHTLVTRGGRRCKSGAPKILKFLFKFCRFLILSPQNICFVSHKKNIFNYILTPYFVRPRPAHFLLYMLPFQFFFCLPFLPFLPLKNNFTRLLFQLSFFPLCRIRIYGNFQ
jgi:hypothetical protein